MPTSDKKKRAKLLRFTRSLKDKPCADCKQTFPPVVMQFDHLDPSTKNMRGRRSFSCLRSKRRILEESLKCEVVCANCHMIRTEKRNGFRPIKLTGTFQLEFVDPSPTEGRARDAD